MKVTPKIEIDAEALELHFSFKAGIFESAETVDLSPLADAIEERIMARLAEQESAELWRDW